jgi:site-specific recombinase XerD
MINRENFKLINIFLAYRIEVDQITPGSKQKEITHLRYLLEWADHIGFIKVSSLRPTFPEYMLSARQDDQEGQLSAEYIKKVLATARRFFSWLILNQPGHRTIKPAWIVTIKSKRLSNPHRNSEAVSLEEIKAIAKAPVMNTGERRTRAMAVMLFLSGMRIGAFVSLPLESVDLDNLVITQFPSLGVKTKNQKYAKTTLLNIPELLEVVKAWDNEVRSILPSRGFWFAPLSPDTGEIDINRLKLGDHRMTSACKHLKTWLEKSGLKYHSPHKFRHGFAHYGMANSKTIEDYKAVSQNLMHASMEITDQFYSVLDDSQVHQRINQLGLKIPSSTLETSDKDTFIKELLLLVDRLKAS